MGDVVFLFFLKNIFTFSIIFWFLFYIASFSYKIKNHKSKKHFCECGFKALSDINIQINLNFVMLCIFLILYDIEFILLFPFLFNIWNVYFLQLMVFISFLYLIIVSLYYDWKTNSLSWQF